MVRKTPKKRDLNKILENSPNKKLKFVIYFDMMNVFIRYFHIFYNTIFDEDNRDVGQIINQLNFILTFIDKYELEFPHSCLYNAVIEFGRSKKHESMRKEYKKNRDITEDVWLEMDEEERIEEINKKESFKNQKQRLKNILTSLDFINTIESHYLEGDFVIRYLMEVYEKMFPDDQVVHIIVSNDSDLKQLMSKDLDYNVFIYDFKEGLKSKDDFEEEFPEKIVFQKQLIGDSSDNIRGIPSIGKKRQETIISELKEGLDQKMSQNEFREFLSQNLEEITNQNLRYKLRDNIDLVVQNYKMVNLININNVIDFLNYDFIKRVNEQTKEYVLKRKNDEKVLKKIKFIQKLKEEKIFDLLNFNALLDFSVSNIK